MVLYSNKRTFDPAIPAEPLGITTGSIGLGDPVTPVPLQVISLNIKELLQQLQENKAASFRAKEVQFYDPKLQTVRKTQQDFRYPPFTAFGFLYPWGVNTEMDGLVRRKLQLRQIHQPVATLGYYGDGRNMTFFLPTTESQKGAYYTRSDIYTGIGFLSLMSMLTCMRDNGVCVPEVETLMRYICNTMATALPGFVNPSLPFLSLFWNDSTQDKTPARIVVRSARALISSIVGRLPKESIIRYANESMSKLTGDRSEVADPMIPLVNLAIIVLDRLEVFDRDIVAYVADEFIKILFSEPSQNTVTAIEFINRGFEIWKPRKPQSFFIYVKSYVIIFFSFFHRHGQSNVDPEQTLPHFVDAPEIQNAVAIR